MCIQHLHTVAQSMYAYTQDLACVSTYIILYCMQDCMSLFGELLNDDVIRLKCSSCQKSNYKPNNKKESGQFLTPHPQAH